MLDWNRFESLAGANTEKFEKLCRSIVRRQFGYLGALKELKNQPGVEYHIELNQDDKRLGNAGETFGWQCKWFTYKDNGELNSTAKTQISHSLEKTKEYLPHLNHWFLWTHKTLSKSDQDWYYGLKTKYGFELHLWNESDLEQLLSGTAIDLRHSYFGELALTPQMLAERHEISVAPIKSRWLHHVHQRMGMEQKIRQILGEPHAWEKFEFARLSLLEVIELIKKEIDEPIYELWRIELIAFSQVCETFCEVCTLFEKTLYEINIEQIDEAIARTVINSQHHIYKVLQKLRRRNLQLSLVLTNALAFIKDIKWLLKSAQELLSHQFIAVVAEAGGGKTQFAAEITAANPNRPAGILLLGRSLKKGHTLDSLAQQITFYNQSVDNFSSLVAAIDAVGTRAGCRLPIVIDGLNEAQDPREWKDLLAAIQAILPKFKNVVLICTLRTGEKNRSDYWNRQNIGNETNSRESFTRQALPDNSYIIESEGFNDDLTIEAIRAYFKHYKIIADPFIAPIEFFSHPLNLKIFCEVTNRRAEENIRVTYFPSSVCSLFKEQIKHSATTIASMTNFAYCYREEEIQRLVYLLGQCLWEENARSVPENQFRHSIKLPSQSWDEDIVNLFAQEGLLFRDDGDDPYSYLLTPVYDRLGGFFVANYLFKKNARFNLSDWMNNDDFLQKLFGNISEQHELSEDILCALIALAPKEKFRQQVWQSLPAQYADKAISLSYLIDKDDFCNETKEAYENYIIQEKLSQSTIKKLWELRRIVGHPLNADFLNSVLKEFSLADRDLSWTEYFRIHHRDYLSVLKETIDNWRTNKWGDAEVERLRAASISWLLTSTCIELRDLATEALFYYGLHHPQQLFKITENLLTVNDYYVSERLLAASYSVATTLLLRGLYIKEVSNFALLLYREMFSETAKASTTHLLTREYASCILQVVNKFLPSVISQEQIQAAIHPFSLMPRKTWDVEIEDERHSRSESPFRMDFENYTIGRLVSGRGNYDYEHSGYKHIRGKILWRVKNLGWNAERFSKIEGDIGSDYYSSRMSRVKTERYGKKYSLIAYYEMAGQLSDEGRLESWRERFATDIDPFFPVNLPAFPKETSAFLGDYSIDTKEWIKNSQQPNLDYILESDGHEWVLIYGFLSEQSKKINRNFYCAVQVYFISSDNYNEIQEKISKKSEIRYPELQQYYSVYAGELYWHITTDYAENDEIEINIGKEIKEIEYPEIMINGVLLSDGGKRFIENIKYKKIPVSVPVIKYYWENEGSSSSNIERVLLSPWIVNELDLKFDPTNLTYTDSDGVLAATYINKEADRCSNFEKLFYFRKDLVCKLINMKKMLFFWKVKGERRLENIDKVLKDDVFLYKGFNFIKLYENEV